MPPTFPASDVSSDAGTNSDGADKFNRSQHYTVRHGIVDLRAKDVALEFSVDRSRVACSVEREARCTVI